MGIHPAPLELGHPWLGPLESIAHAPKGDKKMTARFQDDRTHPQPFIHRWIRFGQWKRTRGLLKSPGHNNLLPSSNILVPRAPKHHQCPTAVQSVQHGTLTNERRNLERVDESDLTRPRTQRISSQNPFRPGHGGESNVQNLGCSAPKSEEKRGNMLPNR